MGSITPRIPARATARERGRRGEAEADAQGRADTLENKAEAVREQTKTDAATIKKVGKLEAEAGKEASAARVKAEKQCGVPLLAPNGQPIGSLCLMDMKPRQFTDREKRLLQEYANDVMEEIAKRAPQAGKADAPALADGAEK